MRLNIDKTPFSNGGAAVTRAAAPGAGRAGFTLMETLVALALFVVLAGIVSAGVPVAWRAYTAAVDTSNAQVLLSTTTTLLRDELGRASQVQVDAVDGQEVVTRYLTGEGLWANLDGEVSGVRKNVYLPVVGSDGVMSASSDVKESVQLVPDAAMTDSLGVTFDTLTYSAKDAAFTVNNLKVTRDTSGETLAEVTAYQVKAIAPEVANG